MKNKRSFHKFFSCNQYVKLSSWMPWDISAANLIALSLVLLLLTLFNYSILQASQCSDTLKIPVKILYDKSFIGQPALKKLINVIKNGSVIFPEDNPKYKVEFIVESVKYDLNVYWKRYLKESIKSESKVSTMDSKSQYPLKVIKNFITRQLTKHGKILGPKMTCNIFANHIGTIAKQAYFINNDVPIEQFTRELPLFAVILPCRTFLKAGNNADLSELETAATDGPMERMLSAFKKLQKSHQGLTVLRKKTTERRMTENLPRSIKMHNGNDLVARESIFYENEREFILVSNYISHLTEYTMYHELLHYFGLPHIFHDEMDITQDYSFPDIKTKSGRDTYCREMKMPVENNPNAFYFKDEDYVVGGVGDTVPAIISRQGYIMGNTYEDYCQKNHYPTLPKPRENWMSYTDCPIGQKDCKKLTLDQKKVVYHFACNFLNP